MLQIFFCSLQSFSALSLALPCHQVTDGKVKAGEALKLR